MGGLLHLVQCLNLPRPLLTVQNVTAHPSTASAPITVLVYNGPFLCGFNVPVKGLIKENTNNNTHAYNNKSKPVH